MMEDQTQHDDESYNQDNVGTGILTGAEISTENDALAHLNDGPASGNFHDDGAPSSAPKKIDFQHTFPPMAPSGHWHSEGFPESLQMDLFWSS